MCGRSVNLTAALGSGLVDVLSSKRTSAPLLTDMYRHMVPYVPLKQRYDAYSKYASTVRAGAEDFREIGGLLRKGKLERVALLLDAGAKGQAPAPTRAAGRSALLLADALLVSAASGSLGREILVARFYVNELFFSTEEVVRALEAEDVPRALDAWALGVDSYNSYFTVVNPRIVPKVGEQFAPVRA